ncbi:MAG: hypothetical protein ACYS0H_27615, partial [Planctomycetota bacterium]
MTEQGYKIALLLMVLLPGCGRASTSRLENVRFKIVDEATRKPLKNCELNICRFVYFKSENWTRSPYLDKDAEWYITSAVTDDNGVFTLSLSGIEETHIVVEPGKPYYMTRFSRTSDLAGTKSADHVRVAHFHRGLTNRVYDLKSGMVQTLANSGETAKEPFTEILLTVRRNESEIHGKAEALMRSFQQAIKDADWDKALGFCSENVKSKASDYDSPETFFRDIVPTDEMVSLTKFQASGGTTNRDGQRVKYFCFLQIPRAGSRREVGWGWTVENSNKGWAIDFKTTSLEKGIEQETIRRAREAKEARIRRERLRKGFAVKLTALSKEFLVGQPMLFRVEMSNVSESPISYQAKSSVMVNDSLTVIGPNGHSIEYVGSDYQTMSRNEEIKPGQTVTLADKYDLTSQYRITKPGTYAFRFNGLEQRGIRPSNTVEMEVKPGDL